MLPALFSPPSFEFPLNFLSSQIGGDADGEHPYSYPLLPFPFPFFFFLLNFFLFLQETRFISINTRGAVLFLSSQSSVAKKSQVARNLLMASFTKILSGVDVKKQLAVPSEFMGNLQAPERGSTVNFPVFDENSGEWRQFGYYTRSGGHLKPVFHGGWQEFCRHNGVKAGDRITFTADVSGNYRIVAERITVRIMGTDVWTRDF